MAQPNGSWFLQLAVPFFSPCVKGISLLKWPIWQFADAAADQLVWDRLECERLTDLPVISLDFSFVLLIERLQLTDYLSPVDQLCSNIDQESEANCS